MSKTNPEDKRESSETIRRLLSQAVQQMAQVAESVTAAVQMAQQTAQAVGQLTSDLAARQTSGASQVLQEETGMGERYQVEGGDRSGLLFSNSKRTHDEYQHESLESIRRNRTHVDKVVSDAQSHDQNIRNISTQALQNADETANMVGKQAVRHSDIAIDRQWNVDEQAAFVAKILNDPALEAAVKVKIIEALGTPKK